MKKMVVGIIPTFNIKNEENDPYQDQAKFVLMYVKKILEAGGLPIGILNNDSSYMDICDAYLWPGGNKMQKDYIPFLQDVIKNKKPVLGICLGLQTICTCFNILEDQKEFSDKTYEEVYEENKETRPYLKKLEEGNIHSHYVTKELDSINSARHKIKIEKDSLLYEIVKKEEIDVVSLHSIVIARTPKSLYLSAKAEDGIIEAVEYKDFVLGLQFHPEIEDNKIFFEWLINKAKELKDARDSRSRNR